MLDIDRMSTNELREYIAQRIRETSDPDLLRELLEYIGELINKGGDIGRYRSRTGRHKTHERKGDEDTGAHLKSILNQFKQACTTKGA